MAMPSPTAAALLEWLDAEGLSADSTDDGAVIEVTIPESGDRTLRLVEVPEARLLAISMAASRRVPRARWTALYPLLSEVNASIAMGAWVLDPDRETLLFRLGIPTVGAAYEADALRSVMSYVVGTVGTMESAFAGTTEDDVLASWMDESEE